MLENGRVSVMVLNATFNNISVFIYGEDWTIRKKNTDLPQAILYHTMLYRVHFP